MEEIIINVNNKQKVKVKFNVKENIQVELYNSKNILERTTTITQGHFISMLNWYYYQKENGNKDLLF